MEEWESIEDSSDLETELRTPYGRESIGCIAGN